MSASVGPRQRPIASSPYGRKGSTPNSPGGGSPVPAVDPRRAKKRELDRRCQRMARERTKNRIAYLESLVEDFRSQDGSGRLAKLMQQLDDLSKERDELKKVVRAVEGVIKNVPAPEDVVPILAMDDLTVKSEGTDSTGRGPTSIPSVLKPRAPSTTISSKAPIRKPVVEVDSESPDSDEDDDESEPSRPSLKPNVVVTSTERQRSYSMNTGAVTKYPLTSTISHRASSVSGAVKPTRSKHMHVCECRDEHPQPSFGSEFNMWRFANLTLDWKPLLDDGLMELEDRLADDIPIRAVVEGWDAVEEMFRALRAQGVLRRTDSSQDFEGSEEPEWDDGETSLPPLWRKLRRVDTVIFSHCAPIERIAILRIVHLFCRWQAQPTASRTASLPAWYHHRPCQTALAHSSAIDFWPWPGMRERFVFKEHRYCGNQFWSLFCHSLRFVWPHDFDKCFERVKLNAKRPAADPSPLSGAVLPHFYRMTPKFVSRVIEIDAWTMGRDFFERWPEFYSDVRTWGHPPMEMGALTIDSAMEEVDEDEQAETEIQGSPKRKRAGTNQTQAKPPQKGAGPIVKRNRSQSSTSAASSLAARSAVASSTGTHGPLSAVYHPDFRATVSPIQEGRSEQSRQQVQRASQQRGQPQRRQPQNSNIAPLGYEFESAGPRGNRRPSSHHAVAPSPMTAAMLPSNSNLLSPDSQLQGATPVSDQGWWSASPTDMSVGSAYASTPFVMGASMAGPPRPHNQEGASYAHSPFATQQVDRNYTGMPYNPALDMAAGTSPIGDIGVMASVDGRRPRNQREAQYFAQMRAEQPRDVWQGVATSVGMPFELSGYGVAVTSGGDSGAGMHSYDFSGFER